MTRLIGCFFLIFVFLNVSGANPMTSLTNNDFVKGYYGIYTSNSGYTGDIGDDTHPADNQWVGIANLRQQEKSTSIIPQEVMYCRSNSTYTPFTDQNDPYQVSLVSQAPNVYFCPQQVIIDPIGKAQKTITQDVLQISLESKLWVTKFLPPILYYLFSLIQLKQSPSDYLTVFRYYVKKG